MVRTFCRTLTLSLVSFTVAATAYAAPYTVKSGDSLWQIALKNGSSAQQILSVNHLTSYGIYSGQKLVLPAVSTSGSSVYTVQDNDTMWIISKNFGVSLQSLIKANPQITDPNRIWRGLQLYIPQPASSPQQSQQPSQQAPEPSSQQSSEQSSEPSSEQSSEQSPKQPTQQPSQPQQPAPSQETGIYQDGVFPLPIGLYNSYSDDYGESRSWSPQGETVRFHEGVDILSAKGTPISSVLDGIIVNMGWSEYGGWRMTIRVDSDTDFYYAHMSRYADGLKQGDTVRKGQIIGYVGSTGYGPVGTEDKFVSHLHFGIYRTTPYHAVDPYANLVGWESSAASK